ncbi:hypothetical protein LA5095_00764 [Roseibium album]|uniref:Uncharacterized protein n=2 Tax=Roseibium album TaxID=311410 RepID=A0A0M6ZE75_9HYPH|nr:hypothetical protein LA5094_03205 [Roseibium album]CTQ66171.1 hypothetical protein LA5095_00764 [Roseibium album]CTQ74069.1 hypothetical protein LA5096_03904 [Roseibium album]
MVIMQIFDPSTPFLAGQSCKGACDVYYCVPVGNFFLAWIDRGLHSPGTGLLSIAGGWMMPIDVGIPMVVGIGSAGNTIPLATAFDRDERYRKCAGRAVSRGRDGGSAGPRVS